MTVTNTTAKGRANGDGVTTNFTVDFKINSASDLIVEQIADADGAVTAQTLDTHYTVAINADTDGATITFVTPPPATHDVFWRRSLAKTQAADIPTEGNFNETQVENALDKSRMIDIEQQEEIDRAIKMTLRTLTSTPDFPEPVALGAIRWNLAKTALEAVALTSLPTATISTFMESPLLQGNAPDFFESLQLMGSGSTVLVTGDVTLTKADSGKSYLATSGNHTITLPSDDTTGLQCFLFTYAGTLAGNLKITGSTVNDNIDHDDTSTFFLEEGESVLFWRTNVVNTNWSTQRLNARHTVGKNYIINPEFLIGQQGVSFTSATTPVNNDGTYLFDQWILLSDGNDAVDVTQEVSSVPSKGFNSAAKLDVETANKKFGLLQFLTNKTTKALRGKSMTLSFYARDESGNANLSKVKAAVVSWSGTADNPTSDIISTWNAGDTDPTLIANAAFVAGEAADNESSLTTSWTRKTISDVEIPANCNNLGVFIWYDEGDASVGDIAYLSGVKLEVGTVPTRFEAPDFMEELRKCEDFWEQSYPYQTPPGDTGANGSQEVVLGAAIANGVNLANIRFKQTKRANPTVTIYATGSGTSGKVRDLNAAADKTVSVVNNSTSGCSVQNATGGALTDGNSHAWHYTADNRL